MMKPSPTHVVDELLGLQLNIFQRYHTHESIKDLQPAIDRRDELRKWLMMIADTSGETPPARDASGT